MRFTFPIKPLYIFSLSTFCAFLMAACNLEKEIEIKLPPYESKLVVECYLVPNEPFRLLLQSSVSYFDLLTLPDVRNATVLIKHRGQTDTLRYGLLVDTLNLKAYNYTSQNLVPAHYGEDFELYIKDSLGREVRARTTMRSVVPLDSVRWKFREKDSTAFLLMYFFDKAEEVNAYRLTINRNTPSGERKGDFEFSDELFSGQVIPIGTRYEYKPQDTLVLTLYHLENIYWQFLEGKEDARRSNMNPFAQGARVPTNIENGLGIFTALSFDQEQIIIR
ncbi:MAG: DUF4249 domain-containing protein [Cytophagales bacterium]|nr:MAG: DUF4249 domain-containing protein [Cytophagales bacterium]TAF60328.1 MAG: DUF4249 domain-containing protein [Cytophagales bacterium]